MASHAGAATPPKGASSPGKSVSARIAEQQKQIDAQRAQIERQQALIESQKALADSQSVRIEEQQARLQALEAQLDTMRTRLTELEGEAGMPAWETKVEERLKAVEAASKKSPELPPDVVSAGGFPGSIRIPGSDAAVKFGGRIRTSVVLTLDPLGTDDRFLTNSIPVGVQSTSGEEKRTNISARASVLNTEFRTPAGNEELRAFFEGDFAGTANAFRLRHAYAQFRGFIAGQTWSTFSDPEADHGDLDFEGVSSENVIRQPLLRYWWSPVTGRRLALAIETPAVSITGGQGVNLFPDAIARGYFGLKEGGHIQVAGVLRQIRGQTYSGLVRTVWGGGGSVSGVLPFRVARLTDRVVFQLNGGIGIARYINDLGSLGGQDAVFDTTTGNLQALPAIGWYVDYQHVWKEWETMKDMNLRSTLLWSYVGVNNLDIQPADAYWKTQRLVANLVFSPTGRTDVGLEYIFGRRTNKDGQSGTANQIQLVALIRF